MNALKTLSRHTSHYLLGRVCVLLLGFVSFPLFTRIFTVAEYGLMSLALRIVALFTVLAKLGIQNSVLRSYEEHSADPDRKALGRYYSTLYFGAAGVGVTGTVIFALGLWGLTGSLVSAGLKRLLLLASVLIFARAMQAILAGFLRVEGRTGAANALDILTKASTIALVCVFFFTWRRSVVSFFVGTLIVELTAVLVITLFLRRRSLLQLGLFDRSFFHQAIAYGFPLVSYEIASVILDSGDRILVQHYLGAQALGLYSAAHNIAVYIEEAMMVPLNLALVPLYMKLWVTKGREETRVFLSRSLDYFLMLAVGVLGVVTLTSRDAIAFLASKKFLDAHQLLPLLVAGLIIYAVHIFLNAGLLIHKKTFTMAKLVFYACGVNIAANIVLLPRIGLMGAAWATLISFTFLIAMLAQASFKFLPLRVDFWRCGRYVLAAGGCTLLLWPVHLNNTFFTLVSKGTAGLLLYGGLLWLLDGHFRELVGKGWRALRAWRQRPPGGPNVAETPGREPELESEKAYVLHVD